MDWRHFSFTMETDTENCQCEALCPLVPLNDAGPFTLCCVGIPSWLRNTVASSLTCSHTVSLLISEKNSLPDNICQVSVTIFANRSLSASHHWWWPNHQPDQHSSSSDQPEMHFWSDDLKKRALIWRPQKSAFLSAKKWNQAFWLKIPHHGNAFVYVLFVK